MSNHRADVMATGVNSTGLPFNDNSVNIKEFAQREIETYAEEDQLSSSDQEGCPKEGSDEARMYSM